MSKQEPKPTPSYKGLLGPPMKGGADCAECGKFYREAWWHRLWCKKGVTSDG